MIRRLALFAICLYIVAFDAGLTTLLAARSVVSMAVAEEAPLVHTLQATFKIATPLEIDYWTADAPRLTTRSATARSHTVRLSRLRPDRLYQYLIRETGTRGTFRTAALPPDLAAIRFSASGTLTEELVLVHLFSEGKDGFKGYVILDEAGQVVWYWRTRDFPFGAARRRNGNFVFMDKGRGVVEVTPGGQSVQEVPQGDAEHEMHHDLITTPADTVLYLAFDTETFQGARLKGEAIWEWSPDSGRLEKRWRSWDHLTPSLDRGPRFGGEWMHANSLAIGPRGNILVSVHYFNQILSLSPDWQHIEWRLGGVRSTIAVPSGNEFSGQHTAHELAGGRVLMFDNGRDRGASSRAVEWRLDGAAAARVWEWSPPTANFASAVSSARRLNNGHTLVAFGMSAGRSDATGPTEAFEVSPEGKVLWHLVVTGTTTMFRVEPVTSIAGESERR